MHEKCGTTGQTPSQLSIHDLLAAAAVVATTVTDDSLGTRLLQQLGQPLEEGQLGELGKLHGPTG